MQNETETPAPVSQPKPARILITEDEYIVAFDLSLRLKRLGYEIVGIAACSDDALLQTQDNQPDLILMDIQLSGKVDGIDTAGLIRRDTDVPIIFLTANSDPATIQRAFSTQACSYLLKPFNERELHFAIERALDQHRHARQLRDANDRLEERVKARTAELSASYSALQNELRLHRNTLEELRAAQQLAKQADQAKSQFLATISHELLTPMNGILGMIDLMLDNNPTQKQSDHLNIVKASAEDLLGLIHDLLDFSRIQYGTLDYSPTTFTLRDQIDAFLKPLSERAAKKYLRLNWKVSPELPAQIVADPIRIGQALVNLVDNAIKFTDLGEVDVRIDRLAQTDQRIQLCITIHDTGIGIPADKQAVIFEPFVQADSSECRRHGGEGLGLSIARRLATIMEGAIEVESQPGAGSTFKLTLWAGLADNSSLTTACL